MMAGRNTIFETKDVDMRTWDETAVATSMGHEDTLRMAKLPGMIKTPGRAVVSTERPRRGHDY
jgi:hypothetical protein